MESFLGSLACKKMLLVLLLLVDDSVVRSKVPSILVTLPPPTGKIASRFRFKDLAFALMKH